MLARILCLLCLASWGFVRAQAPLPWRLALEWPETIRQNDPAEIVLEVAADAMAADAAANSGAEEIPDLFQTYNVVAAAHLELPGMESDLGTAREALQPGHTVTFRWKIRASKAGTYPGTVWLHLELVPKNGGPVKEVLLMARKIEIRAVTVFGLPADTARWVGLAGLGVSLMLGYPFLIGWARHFTRRRT